MTQRVDVAPFGSVVTSDPARMDGARADRIHEYLASDVYLEADVAPGADGAYEVPAWPSERGCLGLRWLERRTLTELVLELAEPTEPAAVGAAPELQGWFGISAWQGDWRPIPAVVEPSGGALRFVLCDDSGEPAAVLTSKVRWVFPGSSRPVVVKRLSAFTSSTWAKAGVAVEYVGGAEAGASMSGEVEVYNGRILSASVGNPARVVSWPMSEALSLELLYATGESSVADRTVLRFRLPSGSFGVAVDDVMATGGVWVKSAGLFVSGGPSALSFDDYSARHKGARTMLEEVRCAPDQSFDDAIVAVHRPIQNAAPTMLSLACENAKFVVERSGRIYHDALALVPQFGSSDAGPVSRHLDGVWLPVPVIECEASGVAYRQRCFVAPLGGGGLADAPAWFKDKALFVAEFVMENAAEEAGVAHLSLSFSAEGDDAPAPALEPSDGRVLVRQEDELVAYVEVREPSGAVLSVSDSDVLFDCDLGPAERAVCTVYMPGWSAKEGDLADAPPPEPLFQNVRPYWEDVLSGACRVEVPDPLIEKLIRASLVHCLLAARSEDGCSRIAPWIDSMRYGPLESEANSIIRAFAFFGLSDVSRRCLDFYIARYSAEGYLTTGYTLMGTGWHLWMLGEHYRLFRDDDWLRSVGPEVVRVCSWVIDQRRKTMVPDARGVRPPEYGLMPPGVMADWNSFAYYFCLNGYYCAGLRSVGRALSAIGDPAGASLLAEAADFREDILRAYDWAQSRMPVFPLRDGTWVPGYPSQLHCPGPTDDFFPGEDGRRSWCYDVELGAHQLVPLGVLDVGRPDVAAMIDHMEDVQFLRSGWYDYPAERNAADPYNLGGFAKVQPYYCRNAEISALRDDVRPFIRSYFNTIPSLLNFEDLSFMEHFNGQGAWNKTHETGYFLHQTRTMLLTERGDELWLAPFVPAHWLEDGKSISVESAPTFFGPCGYRIDSHVGDGFIEVEVDPPRRVPPQRIVLRLRHPGGAPISSVEVAGAPHTDFDAGAGLVHLDPAAGRVKVRVSY